MKYPMKNCGHIIRRMINALIVLLFLLINLSCTDKPGSIIVKNWEIIIDGNPSLDVIKLKDGWKPVDIPATFKLANPPEKRFEFVWLRGQFDIDQNPAEFYGISTGRVRYSDFVYINGRFIGSLPPRKVNWAPMPRNYTIPPGILKTGKNLVHIRLGIYDKYFGGILGNVVVQPEDEFDNTQFLSSLFYKQLPVGIVVLFAGLGITMLVSYFLDRKEKLYLFAHFLALTAILYTFLPLFSHRLVSFELCYAVQFISIILILLIFIMTFQAIYRIYLSNYNRIYIALLFLFILIIFLFRDESYNQSIFFLFVIASVIISVIYFIVMMYQLCSVNPDKFLFCIVCVMFGIALYIIVSEIYLAVTGGLSAELVVTFTPLVFIVLGTIVSTREIKKRKREQELTYDKLKRLEGREISITDTLEEKLKRVLIFMGDNYTSDLSREGLASAVGIHPNYFGRLFKLYTGKTINEYINHLRVEDSVRKLKDKSVKIIDIAFNVGFESIVTFNRAFKKEKGKTPTEFREECDREKDAEGQL